MITLFFGNFVFAFSRDVHDFVVFQQYVKGLRQNVVQLLCAHTSADDEKGFSGLVTPA